MHVRLDQDDELEIPVNVTEESNHLYQLQADGTSRKRGIYRTGQTVSVSRDRFNSHVRQEQNGTTRMEIDECHLGQYRVKWI